MILASSASSRGTATMRSESARERFDAALSDAPEVDHRGGLCRRRHPRMDVEHSLDHAWRSPHAPWEATSNSARVTSARQSATIAPRREAP